MFISLEVQFKYWSQTNYLGVTLSFFWYLFLSKINIKRKREFFSSWATVIWYQFSSSWSFERECHQSRTSQDQRCGGTSATRNMVLVRAPTQPSACSASTILSRGWPCMSRWVDPLEIPPRQWGITWWMYTRMFTITWKMLLIMCLKSLLNDFEQRPAQNFFLIW